MRIIELFRMVFLNILSNKSKCALTSLGIVVGSATIVLVIGIGQGGKLDVEEQYKNLNATAIEVTAGQSADTMMEAAMASMGEGGGGMGGDMGGGMDMGGMGGGMDMGGGMSMGGGSDFSSMGGSSSFSMGGSSSFSVGGSSGGGMSMGGGSSGGGGGGDMGGGSSGGSSGGSGGVALSGAVTLTEEDVADIEAVVPNIEAISLSASGTASVEGGDLEDATDFTVAGVMPEYTEISNLSILYGSFITDDDQEDKNKVCVLGYTTAQNIFGAAYLALGDYISIEGKNYEVIGVLEKMGTVSSGISPDEAIYVPYSTAEKYILSDISPTITVIATDVDSVESVMTNIETVLTQNYPDALFTITDAGSEMQAAQSSANTLQTLLIAVASIVFIVGGIGIMNVLFVTVKERTSEIGLLKALGSQKYVILLEFLLEAGMIAFFGGAIGVGAGYALVPVVEYFGTRTESVAIAGVLALVFAVVTGTLFGFYPALKASKLTPIEALNNE